MADDCLHREKDKGKQRFRVFISSFNKAYPPVVALKKWEQYSFCEQNAHPIFCLLIYRQKNGKMFHPFEKY